MDYWLIVIIVIIIIIIATLWLLNHNTSTNSDTTVNSFNEKVKKPKSIRFVDGTKYDDHKPLSKSFKGTVGYAEITNNTGADLYAKVGIEIFGIDKMVDKLFHIPAGQKMVVDSSDKFELKLLNMLLGKTALYKLAATADAVDAADKQELENFPGIKFDQENAKLYGEVIKQDGKLIAGKVEVK